MVGIPDSILKRLLDVLLTCESFSDDRRLRSTFVNESIHLWQNDLPEADSPVQRARSTIDYLSDKINSDNGENGLILLLNVLKDQIDPKDDRHRRLRELSNELKTWQSETQVIPKQSNVDYIASEDTIALARLVQGLREFRKLHEKLDEWKELHNLLQTCVSSLTNLKNAAKRFRANPKAWDRETVEDLWETCRTDIGYLETFASNIKEIDIPFKSTDGKLTGPSWMIDLANLRNGLTTCLDEGHINTVYNSTSELWDAAFNALRDADKNLRDAAHEISMKYNITLAEYDNDYS